MACRPLTGSGANLDTPSVTLEHGSSPVGALPPPPPPLPPPPLLLPLLPPPLLSLPPLPSLANSDSAARTTSCADGSPPSGAVGMAHDAERMPLPVPPSHAPAALLLLLAAARAPSTRFAGRRRQRSMSGRTRSSSSSRASSASHCVSAALVAHSSPPNDLQHAKPRGSLPLLTGVGSSPRQSCSRRPTCFAPVASPKPPSRSGAHSRRRSARPTASSASSASRRARSVVIAGAAAATPDDEDDNDDDDGGGGGGGGGGSGGGDGGGGGGGGGGGSDARRLVSYCRTTSCTTAPSLPPQPGTAVKGTPSSSRTPAWRGTTVCLSGLLRAEATLAVALLCAMPPEIVKPVAR